MATATPDTYTGASGSTVNLGRSAGGGVDVFNSMPYALGVDSQGYLLGWIVCANVTRYEVSVDGGSTWTNRLLNQWMLVTGRTPGSTDSVIVRAFGASGSADMTMSVTMASGTLLTIFSVCGSGTNPFTGGAADFADGPAWANAGTTINGGNVSLVATNKKLVGLLLKQQFTSRVVIGNGAGVGLPSNTMTTDQTRCRELSVFPGHSLCDVGSVQNLPLRYDGTKGAAILLLSNDGSPVIEQRDEAWSRLSRFIISTRGTGLSNNYGSWGIHSSINTPNRVFADRLLIESGTDKYVFSYNYSNHVISNSIAVQFRPLGQPTPETITEEANGCLHYHNTVVSVGQPPGEAMTARMPATTWTNSAFHGCLFLFDLSQVGSTGAPTFSGCASSIQYYKDFGGGNAALPAGVAYTPITGFVSTTFGTGNYDLRINAGSPLIAGGTYDANYPCDFFYRRRPTSGGVDIGAYQRP